MSRFLKICITLLCAVFPVSLFAQGDNVQNTEKFSIISVEPVSFSEIDITFNEDVVISNIRVLLEDQIMRGMLEVDNYTEGNNPQTVRVKLSSSMQPSTAYKLTVSTATSTKGNTISAGLDAIRDFVTPVTFNEDNEVLPAPANTHAVTSQELNTNTHISSTSTGVTEEGKQPISENNNSTLPETGMGMFGIFCVVAIMFSALLMKRKKNL